MAVSKKGLRSGKVGDEIYRVINGRQTVYAAPAQYKQPNSAAQMSVRSKWANIVAMYRAMKPFAALCIECEAGGANHYNRFISVNLQKPEVYITKKLNKLGGGVVAPYWVSQGTLDAVVVTGCGREAATDIALGGLEIGAETSVGELAEAVVTNNEQWEYGDRILFLLFTQKVDGAVGTPTISAGCWNVALVQNDPARLAEAGGGVGFTSRGGHLAVSDTDLGNSGFCWVHTRETAGGKLLASPQRLIVSNTLLPSYMGDAARQTSMRSYGLKPSAFITPETIR